MSEELVPIPPREIALLSRVEQMLSEANTLPDLRLAMEAAGSISDAAKRYQRLLNAQGIASDAAIQAGKVAKDAAAIRIEAQAKAGEILKQMPKNPGGKPGVRAETVSAQSLPTTAELLGRPKRNAEQDANLWKRMADIPSEVRSAYVRQTDEVTTSGLLKFAKEPAEPRTDQREDMEKAYDEAVRLLTALGRLDLKILGGHAINTQRKLKYRRALEVAAKRIDEAMQLFG